MQLPADLNLIGRWPGIYLMMKEIGMNNYATAPKRGKNKTAAQAEAYDFEVGLIQGDVYDALQVTYANALERTRIAIERQEPDLERVVKNTFESYEVIQHLMNRFQELGVNPYEDTGAFDSQWYGKRIEDLYADLTDDEKKELLQRGIILCNAM
jgi:hypothetical protein